MHDDKSNGHCENERHHEECGHGKRRPGSIKGFREACILLLLAQNPTYGYQLVDDLQHFGIDVSQDVGALYRLLRRLEDEGKVKSEWDTEGAGPARRSYEITETGRQALAQWTDILTSSKQRIEKFISEYKRITGSDQGGI